MTPDDSIEMGVLKFVRDVSPARWVVERIHGFAVNVGSIVPEGFEAYARVFHPAARVVWDDSVPEERPRDSDAAAAVGVRPRAVVPVPWAEVAAANGRVMHAEAQFETISGVDPWSARGQAGVWDSPPEVGRLPREVGTRLVEILGQYTSTPERCWFCVWEGWGGLRKPAGLDDRVRLPGREYLLVAAPIAAVLGSFQKIYAEGPSIWWPDDRAWCVATEIDFRWTYVAGSMSCVEAVLVDDELEALPARLDHRVDIASDHVNPIPDEVRRRHPGGDS